MDMVRTCKVFFQRDFKREIAFYGAHYYPVLCKHISLISAFTKWPYPSIVCRMKKNKALENYYNE